MLEMETEKINAEHLPTNSLAKKYSTVELFGNVTKMSSPDYFFYDRFLQELAESEVETPFERIFKVEKSSRTQEFTFKISYHDKNDEPQSFTEWKSFFSWTRISSWKFWRRIRKTKIYVLPVGPFPDFITRGSLNVDQVNLFEIILKFAEVYFPGISFTLLPAIEFKELGCKTRFHHRTRQLQILVSDVLEQLHKARPKDSFGIVGLLWVDLYPSEEENHIVGEGCFSTGCAALGFGHYSLKCIDGEVQKVEVKSADGTHQRNTNTTFSCSGKEGSPDHILSKCRKGESKHRHKSWKDGMKTVKERRQSGEYMHTKLLHTTSEIGLRNFSTGLKIPPLYSMRGARSMSYTDISSGNLMTIDKELTCSFLSLKEIGHQTRISSSSWLQLFSDDSSGFGSSFEDFEIINTIDENSSEPRSDELGGDLSVIDALPFGTDFMLTCAVLWRLLRLRDQLQVAEEMMLTENPLLPTDSCKEDTAETFHFLDEDNN